MTNLYKVQRNFKDYFILSLKGMAMGAADAVPGVSGGTIAFIAGIYEELIRTISQINFSLIGTLRKQGIKAFWTQINGAFLLALLTGIAISFVSFMRLAKYLIENHPILIWSFFFGLVLASILFVIKQITQWSIKQVVLLTLGAFLAYYITTLPALATNPNPLYFFFAAALAICAMILPGISGSFILVLLGAYKGLSDAIHDFDVKKIIIFISGAVLGLLSFSRILKWLFTRYKNATLAVLTGFIAGSLNKIWPWKKVITWRTNSKENRIPLLEESILPNQYEFLYQKDPQIILAIALMVLGFLCIFTLEKIGSKS